MMDLRFENCLIKQENSRNILNFWMSLYSILFSNLLYLLRSENKNQAFLKQIVVEFTYFLPRFIVCAGPGLIQKERHIIESSSRAVPTSFLAAAVASAVGLTPPRWWWLYLLWCISHQQQQKFWTQFWANNCGLSAEWNWIKYSYSYSVKTESNK